MISVILVFGISATSQWHENVIWQKMATVRQWILENQLYHRYSKPPTPPWISKINWIFQLVIRIKRSRYISYSGDRHCTYHTGNQNTNLPSKFCPNQEHWPSTSHTKESCTNLCKRLHDCPQADFYHASSECWIFRDTFCKEETLAKEDYIVCQSRFCICYA